MSLSPFDSFQSRFVTYLLNFPRITKIVTRHKTVQSDDFQLFRSKKKKTNIYFINQYVLILVELNQILSLCKCVSNYVDISTLRSPTSFIG